MSSTIELTAQLLLESGCLSTCEFLFEQDHPSDSSEISGTLQCHADDEDGEKNAPRRVLNAVKLSLLLTRTCSQYYHRRGNSFDVAALRVDSFVVRLRCSPGADGEDGGTPRAGEEGVRSISSVDQFNALSSNGRLRCILLDMDVRCFDLGVASANTDVAAVMKSVGTLLYAIFAPNGAQVPEVQASDCDIDRDLCITPPFSKTKRNASQSFFQQLIERNYPISVCRLLNDLIEGAKVPHPISSFEDIIQDLEAMNAQPHIFLHNPEIEFCASTIQFGQRHHGRSQELATLLEITTVPNTRNVGLETIFVSGKTLTFIELHFWQPHPSNSIHIIHQVSQGVAR